MSTQPASTATRLAALDTLGSFGRDTQTHRSSVAAAWLLWVFAAVACVGLAGCKHPIRALVGGKMDLGGKMGVDGDIRMTGEVATVTRTDNTVSPVRPVAIANQSARGGQKIAIIDVDGLILNRNFSGLNSMGENPVSLFREKMRRVQCDTSISAVVLRINTPGGGVTATDILAHEVIELRKCRDIPIVACLMTNGCGGGYYLATHADSIVAHPTSVVGGIGVILNTYNLEDTMAQYNVIPITVKAGDKIDLGSPQRTMEIAERKILQEMANEFHDRFIAQVRRSRGSRLRPEEDLIDADDLKLRDRLARGDQDDEGDDEDDDDESQRKVADIFDGRVWTGEQAVAVGLVDRTGYLDDAIDVAARLARLPSDSPVVLLRRDNDRAMTEFDMTPNEPMSSLLPLSIPGLDRSKLPTFLYLWQPEPSFVSAGG